MHSNGVGHNGGSWTDSFMGDVNSQASDRWLQQAENTILNLSSSNDDIFGLISSANQAGTNKEMRMMMIQELMSQRRNLLQLISNIMKMLADTALAIIRNIRA